MNFKRGIRERGLSVNQATALLPLFSLNRSQILPPSAACQSHLSDGDTAQQIKFCESPGLEECWVPTMICSHRTGSRRQIFLPILPIMADPRLQRADSQAGFLEFSCEGAGMAQPANASVGPDHGRRTTGAGDARATITCHA